MTQDEIIEMWNSVIKYAPSEVRITEFTKLVAAKAIADLESQEPVADDFFKMIADKNPKPFPLPQRTWVGLTDEEMMDAIYVDDTPMQRGRRVEAKLKEKNCAG